MLYLANGRKMMVKDLEKYLAPGNNYYSSKTIISWQLLLLTWRNCIWPKYWANFD